MNNEQIPIARTPDFFRTAKALGDYIKALPLTVEQNDQLVALSVAHVNAAEKSGCTYTTAISTAAPMRALGS